MDGKLREAIAQYRVKVNQASKELTKKEHFKDLLHRLYPQGEIQPILDAMSAGSEYTILSIPRKDRLHRGSADTLYNKVIIEFENDLRRSGTHAKEQLAGYLLGQFRQGEGYNFTLIASDLITWKVYAPDVSQLNDLGSYTEETLLLAENMDASFTLKDGNEEDFYYWIDRYLFREEKQKATLKRIEQAFGYQSQTFIESYRQLSVWFEEAKRFGEIQVSIEQWKRFLSIAYGKFDAADSTFLIHTYLSVFSKMLAYTIVSGDDYIDETELKGVLNGSIFSKYQIRNFIENDFFHFICSDRAFAKLKKVFRLLAQEIASFDFAHVDEDVLKGVYQELIDLDTRHALGEYYTPDWLCERVVQEFSFKPTDRILDPSCGSGSFLRAAIHRLKDLNPSMTADQVNACIYGIDIHPLSVQIAKTTVLIALGKEVRKLRKPIRINVMMANTLLTPEGTSDLFGERFTVSIDKQRKSVNTAILEDSQLYDEALDLCESLAEQTVGKAKVSAKDFGNILGKIAKGTLTQNIIDSFYEIYQSLKKVKEDGRDTIWKFILSNTYKPYFMRGKFDYIVGNPPWFTYSSIKNEEYQDQLLRLAQHYKVKPTRGSLMPHLEIAAIFLAHCTSYFLRSAEKGAGIQNGKLAFVLPGIFFRGDQHDNTRSGKAKGFKLTSAWDLSEVSPLFRILSCVLFAEKANVIRELPKGGLPGITFEGRLPNHNCNLIVASKRLKEEPVKFFYSSLGKSTALTTTKSKKEIKPNPYKPLFKQGATIVPRTLYFVDVEGGLPEDLEDRILTIKTSETVKPDAKTPWKGLDLSGQIESRYLFSTALSKSIFPYCVYGFELVVLPIAVNRDTQGRASIEMLSPDKIMRNGDLLASRWFRNCDTLWNINRTEKNRAITSYDYLNWQNKLVDQNLNARYLVVYNASAKDANAGVLDRDDNSLPFLAESICYTFSTDEELEAYYLSALLNSGFANAMIKDFQAKGLFGERHVHKKILDVYFPKFNPSIEEHVGLAEACRKLSIEAREFIAAKDLTNYSGGLALGKLRLEIKGNFRKEIAAVENLIKKVYQAEVAVS